MTKFILKTLVLLLLKLEWCLTIIVNIGPAPEIPPPKIFLKEYRSSDSYNGRPVPEQFLTSDKFEDDLVQKNGSDWILKEDIDSVVFACEAGYPIEWELPYSSQFHARQFDFIPLRYSSFTPDNDGNLPPQNNKYVSLLELRAEPRNSFLSINFTCRASETGTQSKSKNHQKNTKTNSIHVFRIGDHILENEWKNLSVKIETDVKTGTKSAILPCRVATPDIRVQLELKTKNNWTPVPIDSENVSYCPKFGFTLEQSKKGDQFKSSEGIYRCMLKSDSEEGNVERGNRRQRSFVYFNVTEGNKGEDRKSDQKNKFVEHSNTTRLDAFYFTDGSFPHLYVCPGSQAKPPKLIVERCQNPAICQVMKDTFFRRHEADTDEINSSEVEFKHGCATLFPWEGQMIIQAKQEGLDVLGLYSRIFFPYAGNLTHRLINDGGRYSSLGLTKFVEESRASQASLEERMFITVAFTSTDAIERAKGNEISFTCSKIVQRDRLTAPLLDENELSLNFNAALNEAYDHSPNKSVLVEYSRSSFFEGEPLHFMCFGIPQFYAYGVQLRIVWKNGTSTVLQRKKSKWDLDSVHFQGGHFLASGMLGDEVLPFISEEVKAHKEMERAECFMPWWNSGKWDKLVFDLNVEEATAPEFLGGNEDETVYLKLGSLNQLIVWVISNESVPRPEVNLLKDGKPLLEESLEVVKSNLSFYTDLESYRLWKSDNVTIRFPNISLEIQGTYSCVVENAKKKVVKSITVNVQIPGGGGNMRTMIMFIVLGVLAFVMFGLGIRYRVQMVERWKSRNSVVIH